ncbi:MAG: signal peptide peptidase SppA [Spirochaetales bacterium]|nr:signal peptide peptidase SppA [Spirochaetales bacterium]
MDGKNPPQCRSWGPSPFAKHVAVVWLTGDIGDDRGRPGTSIGQDAADKIRELREDWTVSGIIMRVNSGGGTVLTSDLIASEVRKTVDAGKPVAVSMGDVAASGGYYISAYASRIFADAATITGSIGVTGLRFDLSKLIENLGIKPETVRTSPSADFGSLFDPDAGNTGEILREFISATYDQFVANVTAGRKMSREQVLALGEGRIWTGREALANGLVDELGGLSETMAWMEKQLGGRVDYHDVFTREPYFWARLLGNLPEAASEFTAAVAAESKPEWVTQVEAEFGPMAEKFAGLLRLGSGLLYYCPENLDRVK